MCVLGGPEAEARAEAGRKTQQAAQAAGGEATDVGAGVVMWCACGADSAVCALRVLTRWAGGELDGKVAADELSCATVGGNKRAL